MGSSGTKSKTQSNTESSKEKIQNEEPKQVSRKDPNNTHQKHLRQNESIIELSKPFLELEPHISKELSKEICRIVMETQNGKIIGTGFILAFPIDL